MSAVWFIAMLVLIFLVVAILTSPWRKDTAASTHRPDDRVRLAATEVEDLEAARDAKYREIRDAELDRQTSKLSEEDFIAIDGGLRTEAVEILRRLDQAQSRLEKLRAAAAEQQVTTGIDLDVADDEDPELGVEADRQPDPARARPDRD